jgi:hypothetical protein
VGGELYYRGVVEWGFRAPDVRELLKRGAIAGAGLSLRASPDATRGAVWEALVLQQVEQVLGVPAIGFRLADDHGPNLSGSPTSRYSGESSVGDDGLMMIRSGIVARSQFSRFRIIFSTSAMCC